MTERAADDEHEAHRECIFASCPHVMCVCMATAIRYLTHKYTAWLLYIYILGFGDEY